MKYLASHENKPRGSIGFPFEYYHLTKNHPRYEMPFHWHHEYEWLRVLSGTFSLTVNEQTYQLQAGDCALIIGGAIHGGHAQEAVYECIVFDYASICQKHYLEFSKTPTLFESVKSQVMLAPASSPNTPLIHQFFTLFTSPPAGTSMRLQVFGFLLALMGILLSDTAVQAGAERQSKHIDRMKEILSYIKQHYSEVISLEMLATKADLNPKYLCHRFKQLTGKTPIDYLIYYRVECACEQLIYTDHSITDIALSCGFNDISYFIKKFNKLKQSTPLKYRERYQHTTI